MYPLFRFICKQQSYDNMSIYSGLYVLLGQITFMSEKTNPSFVMRLYETAMGSFQN